MLYKRPATARRPPPMAAMAGRAVGWLAAPVDAAALEAREAADPTAADALD